MEIAPEHLTKWVTRMMADLTEEGPPHRFELYHTVDGGVERLEIVRLKEGSEASDISQLLFDSARHDMETRSGGHQRYTVALFRSENQSEPEVQFPFRLQPKVGSSWSGGDTEQPTEKGERAQVMRVQNESHSIIMRMAESVGGRLSHENDRLHKELLEARQREHLRNLEFEDLQDRRMDREVERAARLQREKMMGDLVGSLLPLAPHVVSQLLSAVSKIGSGGKKDESKNGHESEVAKALTPRASDAEAREVLLKDLFANMSQEEQKGLFQAVDPMHRMVLATLGQAASNIKTEMDKAAFDAGMQKFLKTLSSNEVVGILGALDQGNRNRFLLVYQSYGKEEEKQQEGLPDLLKDQPAPPKQEEASS